MVSYLIDHCVHLIRIASGLNPGQEEDHRPRPSRHPFLFKERISAFLSTHSNCAACCDTSAIGKSTSASRLQFLEMLTCRLAQTYTAKQLYLDMDYT